MSPAIAGIAESEFPTPVKNIHVNWVNPTQSYQQFHVRFLTFLLYAYKLCTGCDRANETNS